jgi:hypothetical protein
MLRGLGMHTLYSKGSWRGGSFSSKVLVAVETCLDSRAEVSGVKQGRLLLCALSHAVDVKCGHPLLPVEVSCLWCSCINTITSAAAPYPPPPILLPVTAHPTPGAPELQPCVSCRLPGLL